MREASSIETWAGASAAAKAFAVAGDAVTDAVKAPEFLEAPRPSRKAAVAYDSGLGVKVARVMTDNGSCY